MTDKLIKSDNGQWSLEKSGKKPGDWMYSTNDPRRKFIERKRAEEAEKLKAERAEAEEKARVANITNPFTGQVDRFNPEQEAAHKQAMQGQASKPSEVPEQAVMVPKLAAQQKAKAFEEVSHAQDMQRQTAGELHMNNILSGKKPPVTMWEKAALANHMKKQQEALNAPETKVSKPKGMVVRRKADGEDFGKSDMSKADYEMDMSNLIELLHHIKELKANLKEGDELPAWVSAKLTLATDYLSRIAHYVDGKKEMNSPLNKSKLDQLEKALKQLKKEDYWQSKKPVDAIARENAKNLEAFKQAKMGVGQSSGSKLQVGSDPRLSGIAKEYEMGKTKSGKSVMSLPDHASHGNFTEADHGDAFVFHKRMRDDLKADPQVNPKLVQHHQDAAAFHSKMQAQLRASR